MVLGAGREMLGTGLAITGWGNCICSGSEQEQEGSEPGRAACCRPQVLVSAGPWAVPLELWRLLGAAWLSCGFAVVPEGLRSATGSHGRRANPGDTPWAGSPRHLQLPKGCYPL